MKTIPELLRELDSLHVTGEEDQHLADIIKDIGKGVSEHKILHDEFEELVEDLKIHERIAQSSDNESTLRTMYFLVTAMLEAIPL